MSSKKNLRIGWWNTGLCAKAGKNPPSPKHIEIAIETCKLLVDTENFDFLALGEVDQTQLKNIKNAVNPRQQTNEAAISQNIGILYNPGSMALKESIIIEERQAKTKLNNGVKFEMEIVGKDLSVSIFVVHWPSRMVAENVTKRSYLASRLMDRINSEEKDEDGPKPFIIALGDFNDEPFDQSVNNLLCSSRDRSSACRGSKRLLYNPFWRHLGEGEALTQQMAGIPRGAGSYFYKSNTSWHTFDQILVSGTFLEASQLTLNECFTGIWQKPPLINLKTGRPDSDADHFPVYAEFISK